MKCSRCGSENAAGAKFCQNCGAPLSENGTESFHQADHRGGSCSQASGDGASGYQNGPSNFNQQGYGPQNHGSQAYQASGYSDPNAAPPIPEEYKPISMWGYFGYELLFSIPVVGLILLIVFSVGGTQNKNLKNFARSYFCFLLVVLIIIAVLVASGMIYSIGSAAHYS